MPEGCSSLLNLLLLRWSFESVVILFRITSRGASRRGGFPMLSWSSKPFRHCGPWSRRALLRAGALGFGGLTLPDLLAAEAASPRRAKARSCIFIFLNGGASQLDTFDLKPDAPSGIRGPYRPIATRTSGISLCEKLPRLAQW